MNFDAYASLNDTDAALRMLQLAPDKASMSSLMQDFFFKFVRTGKRLYYSLADELLTIHKRLTLKGVSKMSLQEIAEFEDNVRTVRLLRARNGEWGRWGYSELMAANRRQKTLRRVFPDLKGGANPTVTLWPWN